MPVQLQQVTVYNLLLQQINEQTASELATVVSVLTDLYHLFSDCVQRRLHNADAEHAMAAARLSIQRSVGNLPPLLTYI